MLNVLEAFEFKGLDWHFFTKNRRDLPNPVKRLIVRVMSHYRESSGGYCSEQDKEGEKHRING